jgi:hypothetical protein
MCEPPDNCIEGSLALLLRSALTREVLMTVATSTLLGRPLWHELITTDMRAAERFYRTVVGWTSAPFESAPMPYTMFNRSGEIPVAGVMETPEGMNMPFLPSPLTPHPFP